MLLENTISKLNAKKIQYPVYFGYNNNHKIEEDIIISTQLMNPPIIRNDDYFWIRDESRKNKDVLNLINSDKR